MNDTNGGATMVAATLAENEHVRELLGILKDNGRDTAGLTALISHVTDMESFVRRAEDKLSEMKSQLDTMKEIQNHPLKTALRNTIKALEAKVAEIKGQIAELKSGVIEGCRNAVTAFKENGAAALDKLASFFHIKSGLRSIDKNIEASIRLDDKAMARIEAFSREYHTAGRHLKNMGLVLTGRQPIDEAKQSGKLAKAISAPYKADKACLLAMRKAVHKILGSIERLEQKTTAIQEKQAAAKTEKKPSLSEKLKTNKELIRQKERERPMPERARAPGIEV